MTDKLSITAYEIHPGEGEGWTLRPASQKREWMSMNGNHAYRCLPLVAANHMGWVIECPVGFTAVWDGNTTDKIEREQALQFTFDEEPERWSKRINGHFGNGIISFGLPWLFHTDENVGIIVRGPTNYWKENTSPLDGFTETWWLPFRFTMNWKVLKADIPVRFEKGEPLCLVYPYETRMVSDVTAEIRPITDNPDLKEEYDRWVFMRYVTEHTDIEDALPAFKGKYVRGQDYAGSKGENHQKRIPVPKFTDKRINDPD